ncbi:MAG: ParB family chromosome partitioning protein, partial [Candidatus Omnitrophota bacterium]
QEQIATSVGKNRSTVTNMIRLLRLSPSIQEGISARKISSGHARTLLSIDSPDLREHFYRVILEKSLSVRELESLIKSEVRYVPKKKKAVKENGHEIKALEDQLQQILGTKVGVEFKKKRGKITIEYYSLDDLDRIIGIIRK